MLGYTLQVLLSILERELQIFIHQCQGDHARPLLMTGTSQKNANKMSKSQWLNTELFSMNS